MISNIFGPIQPQKITKSNYIVTFVVERSIFVKVYKIKQRLELHDCLAECFGWLEQKAWIPVKRFHSDQAKEYVALREYFRQSGIVHTIPSAYSPESNDVAEQHNCTPLQKARAILLKHV